MIILPSPFVFICFLQHINQSLYYKVVVFNVPLQGQYAILFRDTVDQFSVPTARRLQKGSDHSLFVQLLIS